MKQPRSSGRIIVTLLCLMALAVQAQTPVRLWTGTTEDAPGVTLTPYAASPTGGMAAQQIAVIVCPGGSYCWLDRETEGRGVAEWLQSEGITAFVLEYRTAGIPAFVTHYRAVARGRQHPDMIRDLQMAIRYVRLHAADYGIDPAHVGVMGFSAGGHLVMTAGELWATDFLAPLGVETTVSLRPDFVAPIYPVVTLSDDRYVHKRSRRGLLGEWQKFSHRMRDSLSVERQVRPDMPPVFLVNCKDDPTVRYRNSELLDSALTAQGVAHKYLQYKTGGHGFGADPRKASAECIAWKGEFVEWLKAWINLKQ